MHFKEFDLNMCFAFAIGANIHLDFDIYKGKHFWEFGTNMGHYLIS